MNPNNNKNKKETLVAADVRLQIINNTLINAAKSSANAWIKVQFESAVALDSLSSMEDPKFVAWKAWKTYKSYGEDHRYVAWKRELDAEADALALALALAEEALALAEEAKAEENDSKYDELPLHERYTWYSTDEDDSDSEEDSEEDKA